MKTLSQFILERKSHLRNVELDIDESLKDIDGSFHSDIERGKKNSSDNNLGGINKNEIRKCIEQIDDELVNYLLNKFSSKDMFGFKRKEKNSNIWMWFIFVVSNFNKETFEYDIKIVTNNRYTFKPKINNVKLCYEQDKGRPRRVES